MNRTLGVLVILVARGILETTAFIVPGTAAKSSDRMQLAVNKDAHEPAKRGGFFQAFGDFWEELDAFMDDAS